MDQQVSGPLSYKNWKVALAGQPSLSAYEHPLFSDTHFFVDNMIKQFGPYCLFCLNPVSPIYSSSLYTPTLILRIDNHLQGNSSVNPMNRTDEQYYSGGLDADEITALMSLSTGIRLKAGDANRFFGDSDNPRGLPMEYGRRQDPIIIPNPSIGRPYVLPSAFQRQSLDKINMLSTFPDLSESEATVLLRAARMYQEAVWLVESTPEISWILLTSMIETVANYWKNSTSSLDKFKASQLGRQLEPQLRNHAKNSASADALITETANILANYTGVTAKFRDFILEHLPPPPPVRPYKFAQHPWAEDNSGKKTMKNTLETIYKYRSRALHAGHPFPAPMCDPPQKMGENGAFAEIPSGSEVGMKGAVWVKKDIPILLHTFEYIARNAVLNWWRKIASGNGYINPLQE